MSLEEFIDRYNAGEREALARALAVHVASIRICAVVLRRMGLPVSSRRPKRQPARVRLNLTSPAAIKAYWKSRRAA